jgi:hypothetical protein
MANTLMSTTLTAINAIGQMGTAVQGGATLCSLFGNTLPMKKLDILADLSSKLNMLRDLRTFTAISAVVLGSALLYSLFRNTTKLDTLNKSVEKLKYLSNVSKTLRQIEVSIRQLTASPTGQQSPATTTPDQTTDDEPRGNGEGAT